MSREFDLPILDRSEGEWTIYDLPQITLPYPAPARGMFLCYCEMEVWDDEPSRIEVVIKTDRPADLRHHLTTETEQKVSQLLASVGLITTSVTPRESGAHTADAIIFVCDIQ